MSVIDRLSWALGDLHENDGCSCRWSEGWIVRDEHCAQYQREVAEELADRLAITESFGFGDTWFNTREKAESFLAKTVGTTATGESISIAVRYTTRAMPLDRP